MTNPCSIFVTLLALLVGMSRRALRIATVPPLPPQSSSGGQAHTVSKGYRMASRLDAASASPERGTSPLSVRVRGANRMGSRDFCTAIMPFVVSTKFEKLPRSGLALHPSL